MNITTAVRIAEATIANGGATVDALTGAALTEGVAVAVKGYEYVADVETLIPSLVAYLGTNADVLAGRCLGTWVHDGKVYLDVAEVVSTREEALTLGRERGEIAVYDLAASEEVEVA